MISQELVTRISEAIEQPTQLLTLLEELSQSVSASEILEAMILSLENSTGAIELKKEQELFQKLSEMIEDYPDSDDKDSLVNEINFFTPPLAAGTY